MRLTILLGLFLFASDVVLAATDQVSSVSYQAAIRSYRQVSATGLTSSDTAYVESRCMGGMLTFTDACETTRGRAVNVGLIYKVSVCNKGTSTVDATLFVFSEPFTSPGDNVAWTLADGPFSKAYLGKVDFSQTAQLEGGGNTYAEAPDVNIPFFCTADRNLYGQLVKNNVGPVTTGGDTRSASADMVVRMYVHQLEPK